MSLYLPPELWDVIIDYLWDDILGLKCCSLVCKRWASRARRQIFQRLSLKANSRSLSLVARLEDELASPLFNYTTDLSLASGMLSRPDGIRGLSPLAHLPYLKRLHLWRQMGKGWSPHDVVHHGDMVTLSAMLNIRSLHLSRLPMLHVGSVISLIRSLDQVETLCLQRIEFAMRLRTMYADEVDKYPSPSSNLKNICIEPEGRATDFNRLYIWLGNGGPYERLHFGDLDIENWEPVSRVLRSASKELKHLSLSFLTMQGIHTLDIGVLPVLSTLHVKIDSRAFYNSDSSFFATFMHEFSTLSSRRLDTFRFVIATRNDLPLVPSAVQNLIPWTDWDDVLSSASFRNTNVYIHIPLESKTDIRANKRALQERLPKTLQGRNVVIVDALADPLMALEYFDINPVFLKDSRRAYSA